MITESIRHCLARLMQFAGRDRPSQFWPWALTVFGASMIVWAVTMASVIGGTFDKMQQFARDHPEQVTEQRGPGSYSLQIHGSHPELAPDSSMLVAVMGVIVALHVVLLGAAIVRRLHDSDVRGRVALIPLGLLISGLAIMSRLFSTFGGQGALDMGLFIIGFANNLVYLASIGVLIYLLARAGTAGPNRFGEPPA